METSPPSQSNSTRSLVLLLLAAMALWAVAFWLSAQFPAIPLYRESYFSPSRRAFYWLADSRRHRDERVHRFELLSNSITTVPMSSVPSRGTLTARGQRVYKDIDYEKVTSDGQRIAVTSPLQVYDDLSGRVLWSGPIPFNEATVVGDHFLVATGRDQVCVLDLDEITQITSSLSESSATEVTPTTVDLPGASPWSPLSSSYTLRIEGGNRFLCQLASHTVVAFEIEEQTRLAREIARWPYEKNSSLVIHRDKVYTGSPDLIHVEVRSLHNFQLVNRLPLPSGLSNWNGINTSKELFSFSDPSTAKDCVHRFDDFSQVSDLSVPLLNEYSQETPQGDDARYSILCNSTPSLDRFQVYDAVERRVVLDHAARAGTDISIIDGQLVMVNFASGLTAELIDLKRGSSVTLRPLAWVVIALPVLLIASIAWLVAWLRCSKTWRYRSLVNSPLLIALFATPLALRVAWYREEFAVERSDVGYLGVTLFSIAFACVLYGLCRRRPLMSIVATVLLSALVLSAINLYAANELNVRNEVWARMHVRTLLAFEIVCISLFSCLQLVQRFWRRPATATPASPAAAFPMSDLFILTACVAACMVQAVPNRDYLLETAAIKQAFFESISMVVTACMGLLAWSRSARVVRIISWAALVLALLLIVEVELSLVYANHWPNWWHVHVMDFRHLTFMFLSSFVLCLSRKQ